MAGASPKLRMAGRCLNVVAVLAVVAYMVMTAPQWAAGLWDDEGQLGFLNLGAGGVLVTQDGSWTKAGDSSDQLRAEIVERNASVLALEKDHLQLQERISELTRQNHELLSEGAGGGNGTAAPAVAAVAAPPSAPRELPLAEAAEWELRESRDEFESWVHSAATIEEVKVFRFLRGRVVSVSGSSVRGNFEEYYDCALQGEFCDCSTGHVRFGHPEKGWTYASERGGKECVPKLFPESKVGAALWCQCSILGHLNPNICNGCKEAKNLAPRKDVQADRPRSQLCKGPDAHIELLWSCDPTQSRRPRDPPEHVEAEEVLTKGTAEMCKAKDYKDQLETYLDCDYLEPYLKWTSDGSEWIEEAYLSYIGGPPGNKYEWAMLNLIRSAQMFSTRPIVIVIMGSAYVPPLSWLEFPNLIIYRMKSLFSGLGFNFNKDRAMIGARIITGIELDSDQIITHPRFDDYFAATRKEVTKEYPFLISPVHWMSREPGTKPYPFSGFRGKRSIRWVHAHPTWTYWSIPFIHDILLIKIGSQLSKEVLVWKYFQAPGWWDKQTKPDMLELLREGTAGRIKKKFGREEWMSSDEPALNACYWLVGATKTWCKMDLEPDLWPKQASLRPDMMADPKWFPEGVPLMFYSAHNTKGFSKTDLLLTLLGQCLRDDFYKKVKCPQKQRMAECDLGGGAEEKLRLSDPEKYQDIMCCCVEPRLSKPIFWKGKWYETAAQLPGEKTRGCLAV